MTAIKQEDLIQSVADAFQYISYYHPLDYIKALGEAYEREESPAAKDAIAQILTNSRMSAEGHRPICQDTGIGMVFIKVGMQVTWPDATMSIQQMIDEGVRRAYGNPDNPLRASVLADPAGARKNTKDNTPAVVHFELVPGHHVEVICAAKGGGSEAKSKFAMLNPSDDLVDWVLHKIPEMGAGWCPPGIIGIGIGGTPEKAMLLAKESIMAPVDIHELKAKAATGAKLTRPEELRLELMEKINALGVGAQGLGGLTTVNGQDADRGPRLPAPHKSYFGRNVARGRKKAGPVDLQKSRVITGTGRFSGVRDEVVGPPRPDRPKRTRMGPSYPRHADGMEKRETARPDLR